MTDRISPTFRRIHLLQRVRGSELTYQVSSDPLTLWRRCIRRNVREILSVICSRYPFVSLTLCEATARSTKLRKMQFYKSVFYQKNEALLFITTLPCLKVFASLITKNKSKSSWHTEKFAKNRLKEKSSGRMRTKRQNRKVCISLCSISSSPGH